MNKMKKYKVSTSKRNLPFLNHYNLKNVRIIEDRIEFYTDSKSFEKIKDLPDIEYTDLTSKSINNILRKHLITIIGGILIFIALINQSLSIVDVKFSNPDTYNQEVVDFIEQYYKKVGPFHYLKTNLTEINFDLRSEFYQYEWIGLRKKGSVLYIDIKELVNNPQVDETKPGSYYARYEGIVKRYHIEKGVVVVQEEQYVAKGDLLISGLVTHYNNKIEQVRAKGYVIAEVLQYKFYKIKKESSEVIRTGKMQIVKDYYIFGLKINNTKNIFENSNIEEGKNTNVFDIFKVNRYYRYEVKEIKNSYNAQQAVDLAKSYVYKEFRSQKINEFEKIIFNNLVKIEEDEEYYHVQLIVKSYQNIAEFNEEEIITNNDENNIDN